MTLPEEIEHLKTEIDKAPDEQAEAGLILELLLCYAYNSSKDAEPFIKRLFQLAEKTGGIKYQAWASFFSAVLKRVNGEQQECLILAQTALNLFEETGDLKGSGNAYNIIGTVYYEQINYKEAFKYYKKALEIRQEIDDKQGLAASYNNLGNIHEHEGDYAAALKSHLKALQLRLENGIQDGIAASLNNIAIIHCHQGNYDEALKNCMGSLRIREDLGDKTGMADAHSNIGVMYERMGNYTEALKSYASALKLKQEIGNYGSIALTFNNIGVVYERMKDYKEAMKNFFHSLDLFRQTDDKRGMVACYEGIGSIYEKQGQYDEAVKSKLTAFKISEEIVNKDLISECAVSLFNTYKNNTDFENALKYHEKYHQVEKEMLGELSQKQLTNLNFQHNMEQKEKEAEIERLKNVELKEALEKLKIEKSRSERLFQNQLTELKSSALQAQMNPHFVFNSLNSIQQYIWEKNPEEATAYLSRFSKLIRAVLDNSRKQYVTLAEDLSALGYYIELETLRFDNKFEFRIICDESVNKTDVHLPPMIIQPFVENAIIHGLQHMNTAGKLLVSVKQKSNNVLHITIEDNGVGRQKANEIKMGTEKTHQSVAMQLTKERLEKMISGSVADDAIVISDLFDEQKNPAGTRVEISVPVEFAN